MAAKKKQCKRERKVIIFDENSRREYLLGFRKRKNERRRKAKEDLLKKEKDRKKDLKEERKRALLDQIATRRKELEAFESEHESDEELVADMPVNTTYDHPEHVVTVTTISDVNLDNGSFACIGPNRGLPETVVPPVLNNSDLQDPCTKKEGRIEKSLSKKHKLQNNLKRKQTSTQSERRQDSKSGKRRKRKHFHSHGRSKRSRMS